MIYSGPAPDSAIDQGDIIDGSPLPYLTEYDLNRPGEGRIELVPARIMVMTQTCDLAQRNLSAVTAAVVYEAQYIVDQRLLKPADVRGPFGRPECTVGIFYRHTWSLA